MGGYESCLQTLLLSSHARKPDDLYNITPQNRDQSDVRPAIFMAGVESIPRMKSQKGDSSW